MKQVLAVIFLAGCPDQPADEMPVVDHEPSMPCEGFGLAFWATQLTDHFYFDTSTQWRGEYGSDPKPIARGGAETINIDGEPYVNGMLQAFDAVPNGAALAVTQPTSSWQVSVTGAAVGAADLCIYDHGSDVVHDAQRLVVRDVASVEVVPSDASSDWESVTDAYPFPWVMHTGRMRHFGIALESAEGWRLVDEKMRIELTEDDVGVGFARDTWDSVMVDIADPTQLSVHAFLGDGTALRWATVAVVDRVDRLEHRDGPYSDLTALHVGQDAYACYDAFADDVRVLGAEYVINATTSAVTIVRGTNPNCVIVRPAAPGSGVIHAYVDGVIVDTPYTVLASDGV